MAVTPNIAPPLVSGFIFQQYNLVPTLSAYENIALPWRLDRKRPDRELIMDRMESMGIADLASKLPITLSGGEQQRVARDPGQCVLMVTHDPVVARRCDRVAFMRDGLLVQEMVHPTRDRVAETLNQLMEAWDASPAHRRTARLLDLLVERQPLTFIMVNWSSP